MELDTASLATQAALSNHLSAEVEIYCREQNGREFRIHDWRKGLQRLKKSSRNFIQMLLKILTRHYLLQGSATSLICNSCNKTTTIGVTRFRVELQVESGDRTTTFVLFDKDAKKIIHSTAEDLIASQENKVEDNSIHQTIPSSLIELIGNTLTFQVKISEYSFQSSYPSFTVNRILNQASIPESTANNMLPKIQHRRVKSKR